MKVYVQGYRTTTDEERERLRRTRPFEEVGILVSYTDSPDWTMEQYGVDMHLPTLRSFGIYVGSHFCDFSAEELPDGRFVIICAQHPALHNEPTPQGVIDA